MSIKDDVPDQSPGGSWAWIEIFIDAIFYRHIVPSKKRAYL